MEISELSVVPALLVFPDTEASSLDLIIRVVNKLKGP